jgi:hypothetical protein
MTAATTDRDSLLRVLDHYLLALSRRDPSALQTTDDLKFTENCSTLRLGQGLWATATNKVTYKHAFADPAQGQVACFAVVEEMDVPALLALRLKVEGSLVGEAEHLVARFGNPIFQPEALSEPLQPFTEVEPPETRSSREELVRIAGSYFDAIEQDDGSIVPVDEECYRLENGIKTTSNPESQGIGRLPVVEQLSSGFFDYITQIRDRRYPIVDEERGLVLAIVFFDHPGYVKSVNVPGMGEMKMAPFTQKPSSAMIAELFKVRNGKLRQIEAVLEFLPYGIKSGWG